MASLSDLLKRTFLFTAARDAGNPSIYDAKLTRDASISCTEPAHDQAVPPQHYSVWSWKHDPATPARVTDLKATMRTENGMVMPVCNTIEVLSVSVVLRSGEGFIDLPLTKEFVLSKYKLDSGRVLGTMGWWRLPAEVDQGLLVVFGYELRDGRAQPLELPKVEEFGARFFPNPEGLAPGDPDLGIASADGSGNSVAGTAGGTPAVAYVSNTFIVVAFGFSTCKEAADFFPGNMIGTGRIYPHVMVTCNVDLHKVATKLSIERPEKVKPCHLNMKEEIGSILMADVNEIHAIDTEVSNALSFGYKPAPPIPLWSNFFDYYDLNPKTGADSMEYAVVDPSLGRRTVTGGILREKTTGGYESVSSFVKEPKQGAFDNIHLAPKMFWKLKRMGILDNIAMAPFCVHDCLHVHFRWGMPGPPAKHPTDELMVRGFDGRQPNVLYGAPLVPSDQAVWIRLTSASSLTYRAETTRPAKRGTWTVFFHHGMGYALGVASPGLVAMAKTGVSAIVLARREPYVGPSWDPLSAIGGHGDEGMPSAFQIIKDVDPLDDWAAFYWRLQFTGSSDPATTTPRIKILDLGKCRDT